jgi:hypothetical protein
MGLFLRALVFVSAVTATALSSPVNNIYRRSPKNVYVTNVLTETVLIPPVTVTQQKVVMETMKARTIVKMEVVTMTYTAPVQTISVYKTKVLSETPLPVYYTQTVRKVVQAPAPTQYVQVTQKAYVTPPPIVETQIITEMATPTPVVKNVYQTRTVLMKGMYSQGPMATEVPPLTEGGQVETTGAGVETEVPVETAVPEVPVETAPEGGVYYPEVPFERPEGRPYPQLMKSFFRKRYYSGK